MGIRRGAAAENHQILLARVFDPVGCSRGNADRIPSLYLKHFIPQGHCAFAREHKIQLFRLLMPVQPGLTAGLDRGLGKALLMAGMVQRVHQFPDF